jgi:hypothetical protein
MLLLHYDPMTTEITFKDVADPPTIANFTEFILNSNLQLTTGTVTVDKFMELGQEVIMTINEGAALELV